MDAPTGESTGDAISVETKGAVMRWELVGDGLLDRWKSCDEAEWRQMDRVVYEAAEAAYRAKLLAFLAIPLDDADALAAFCVANKRLFRQHFDIPPEWLGLVRRNFRPSVFSIAAVSSEGMRLSAELHILLVRLSGAAEEAFLQRLVASTWLPVTLTENRRCPLDVGLAEFRRVCGTCIAALRKPFSYLDRGIYPPAHILDDTQIVLQCGLRKRFEFWTPFLFREIFRRLCRGLGDGVRFGPKPGDVFRGLRSTFPFQPPGQARDSLAVTVFYFPYQIRVQATGTCLNFCKGSDSCYLFIQVDHNVVAAFLRHVWAAKVIAFRTRLAEDFCRNLITTHL
jgi:hypothetical protein